MTDITPINNHRESILWSFSTLQWQDMDTGFSGYMRRDGSQLYSAVGATGTPFPE
jgi:hypothetical protein